MWEAGLFITAKNKNKNKNKKQKWYLGEMRMALILL
jgi:hypothetical protein